MLLATALNAWRLRTEWIGRAWRQPCLNGARLQTCACLECLLRCPVCVLPQRVAGVLKPASAVCARAVRPAGDQDGQQVWCRAVHASGGSSAEGHGEKGVQPVSRKGHLLALARCGPADPQLLAPCLPTHALPRPCARVLHTAAPCYRACVDLTRCASVAAQSSKSLARTWA